MSDNHLLTMPSTLGEVRPSAIERLPVDLIFAIIDAILDNYEGDIKLGYFARETAGGQKSACTFTRFDVWKDLVRLAATCRALYNTMTATIYRKDVELNCASALLLSVKKGNMSAVVKSLDQGADVSQNDHTELATWEEYDDGYDEFDEGETDHWGKTYWTNRQTVDIRITPLHWAAFHRNLEATKLLIQRGAEIDGFMVLPLEGEETEGNCGQNRLLCPSVGGIIYQLNSRLCYNNYEFDSPHVFDIDASIAGTLYDSLRDGGNALYCALLGGPRTRSHFSDQEDKTPSAPIAKLLVEAGANLTTLESVGLHALHQVCGNRDLDMAAFLLGRGADPNVRDRLGNTPLHYVAMNGRFPGDEPTWLLVRLLLDHGADVNAVNKAGYTPLHYCVRIAFHDMEGALALCKAGARVYAGFLARLQRIRAVEFVSRSSDQIDEVIMLANRAEQFVGRGVMAWPDDVGEVNEDLRGSEYALFYWLWRDEQHATYVATGDDGVDVETWTSFEWAVYWRAQRRLIYGN